MEPKTLKITITMGDELSTRIENDGFSRIEILGLLMDVTDTVNKKKKVIKTPKSKK